MSDFIRRLEKKHRIAPGQDDQNATVRDALLYRQVHEGLGYDVMLSPAVPGSQGYQELATAVKGEEQRLAALKHCQKYSWANSSTTVPLRGHVKPASSSPEPFETLAI